MGDFGFNRPSNNNGDLSSYNNPKFNGSVSMGRNADSNVGVNSTAMGDNVEASGESSHAEGCDTVAEGNYSHAEGSETMAVGITSHAEGDCSRALGNYSHAEGKNTIASGENSHAEGLSVEASGYCSHAEGGWTTASGNYSHAEGYHTIASSESQHVQGEWNIEDTSTTYVHIVGNGIADDNRSNAHTLDWDGNAWYQGNVSVDGTPTNDNDLTTKKYVDEAVASVSANAVSMDYVEGLLARIEALEKTIADLTNNNE